MSNRPIIPLQWMFPVLFKDVEFIDAGSFISVGLSTFASGDQFGNSQSFGGLCALAPEWFWGALFLITGILILAARGPLCKIIGPVWSLVFRVKSTPEWCRVGAMFLTFIVWCAIAAQSVWWTVAHHTFNAVAVIFVWIALGHYRSFADLADKAKSQ